MTFKRIRTINGRQYGYEEVRWRENGKVKSQSRCLGPIDSAPPPKRKKRQSGGLLAFIEAQRLSPEDRVLATVEREAARVERYQRELFGETARERVGRERQEHLDSLHQRFGLKLGPFNPTPIEKQPTATVLATKESPAEAGPTAESSEKSE
jgi:hypothetical protein